jgi:hypothetical protein
MMIDTKKLAKVLQWKFAEDGITLPVVVKNAQQKDAGLADTIAGAAKWLGKRGMSYGNRAMEKGISLSGKRQGDWLLGGGSRLFKLGKRLRDVNPEAVAQGLNTAKSYAPAAGGMAAGGLVAGEGLGALGQRMNNQVASNYANTNSPTLASLHRETANQWRNARPTTWVRNLLGAGQPAAQ